MSVAISSLILRMEKLESQSDFQDELYESLNTIVAKQDREIIEIKHQLGVLAARLKDLGEAVPGAGPQDETPPHY